MSTTPDRWPLDGVLSDGLLLDGATGTELLARGVAVDRPGWTAAATVESPDVLRAVHADYVAAGAGAITANTFRMHHRNVEPLGLEAAPLVQTAVDIARDAAGSEVAVLGCIAPLADCYDAAAVPDARSLQAEHTRHASHLAAAGVDAAIIETMTTTTEAVVAAQAAREVGLPVLASVAIAADGRLYSGEPLDEAADALREARAAAVLANCFPFTLGDELAAKLQQVLGSATPWGLQPNTSRLTDTGEWAVDGDTSPAAFADAAARWRSMGAAVIGGCCGTTPEHIAAAARLLE